MFDGKIVDIIPAENVTKEMVGLLMAGEIPDDARKIQKAKEAKK
jgi:hypothetical protein